MCKRCGCTSWLTCVFSSNRALFREIEKVLAAQQEKAATAPPTAPSCPDGRADCNTWHERRYL